MSTRILSMMRIWGMGACVHSEAQRRCGFAGATGAGPQSRACDFDKRYMSMKPQIRTIEISGSLVLVVLALSPYVYAQSVRNGGLSPHQHEKPDHAITAAQGEEPDFRALMEQIVKSGRILEIASPPADRLRERPQIPPGKAPVLGFRMLEHQKRFQLGRLDLVVDDAGH